MAERMDSYRGCYCMESFHPFAVKWFKDHRPEIIRGQLSTNYFKDKINRKWYEKFLLSNLMLNFLTKPDFIAYNHLWKKDFSLYSVQKTFQTGECCMDHKKPRRNWKKQKKAFDVIIFDSFIPKKRS